MNRYTASLFLAGFSSLVMIGCGGGGSDGGDNPPPVDVTTVTKSITNATATTNLVNSAGVSVLIPQGAVPRANDGSNQPLVMSIEKKSPPAGAVMPEGYSLTGDTWFVGPENFVFSEALKIGLPYSPQEGMSYSLLKYNGERNRWEAVSTLDENDRSQRFQPLSRGLYDDYKDLYGTAYKAGLYGIGYKQYESLADNPKKTGIITLKNYYTVSPKRFINYCLVKNQSSVKFADQYINDYGSGGPGIIGDGGDVSAIANLELPQGQYTIQIGRTKGTTTDREHHSECDGWFEVQNVNVQGVGGIYYEGVSKVVRSDASINIGDNQSWQSGCAPCQSTFPTPSALYGVGNLGVTLTWQDRTADLDLHVLVPSTTPTDNNLERIYYSHDVSTDGLFKLDIDRKCSNINEGDLTENIFSKTGEHIPSGRYSIGVKFYDSCNGVSTPRCVNFNVRTVVNGEIHTYSDKVCTDDIGPNNEEHYKEVSNFRFE